MPGPRRLTPERARLAELHRDVAQRAVRYCIRRHRIPLHRWPTVEWDDALSNGYEALCRSAISWNVEAGPFPEYAYHRVWFATVDWIRNSGDKTRTGTTRMHAMTVPWVDFLGEEGDGSSKPPTEVLLRDDQHVQDFVDLLAGREFVAQCLSLMTERERYVVFCRLVLGRSIESLAEELGISESRVSQLSRNGLTKVKRSSLFQGAAC